MPIFKCKMCGGDLSVTDGKNITECEYCGTSQTVPSTDSEKLTNLYNRANRLRFNSEFDKAGGVFESIAAEFPEEAEAYWGLCLCKYGIEYVDDPATAKKIPTCHRTSFESIFDDNNFELAQEYADAVAQKLYRDEAKEIDRIQKSILEIAGREEPFDVFICYKETAEDGQRTKDSVLAQDIYDALTAKGYKVFFARITLEDKLGQQYEPYIFSALNSSKVMLSVGTRFEYFNAVWVKNEWSRFLDMMKKDKEKVLIPCYADIDAYDLPQEFRNLQGQDMGKVGFIQDLVRGVGKILGSDTAAAASVPLTGAPPTETMLERAFMCIESRDFEKADELFENVLNIQPRNAQAHYGKFLAQMRYTENQIETNNRLLISSLNNDFRMAQQYAQGGLSDKLNEIVESCERFSEINDRRVSRVQEQKGIYIKQIEQNAQISGKAWAKINSLQGEMDNGMKALEKKIKRAYLIGLGIALVFVVIGFVASSDMEMGERVLSSLIVGAMVYGIYALFCHATASTIRNSRRKKYIKYIQKETLANNTRISESNAANEQLRATALCYCCGERKYSIGICGTCGCDRGYFTVETAMLDSDNTNSRIVYAIPDSFDFLDR